MVGGWGGDGGGSGWRCGVGVRERIFVGLVGVVGLGRSVGEGWEWSGRGVGGRGLRHFLDLRDEDGVGSVGSGLVVVTRTHALPTAHAHAPTQRLLERRKRGGVKFKYSILLLPLPLRVN